MISIPLSFDTLFGTARATLWFESEQVGLAEFARQAMRLAGDAERIAVEDVNRFGTGVSCRKGCGACCRQLVPLSPGEALMIADLVDDLSKLRHAEIVARFAAVEQTLRDADLFEPLSNLDDPSLDDAAHHELARRYFTLGSSCPFLDDESCTIHDRRPAACREYSVASSPSNCADPFNKEIEIIPPALLVKEALAGLAAQLLGGELKVLPLTLALDWARKNADLASRKWDARDLAAKFTLQLEIRS